jgi:ubiquitin-protein ligase
MAADSIEPKTLLRKRLLHDIAELQNRPYSGITLHIQDEDALQQACLILSPEDKPKIHLTVAFGSQYSLSPPTITIQSRVIHPNVSQHDR